MKWIKRVAVVFGVPLAILSGCRSSSRSTITFRRSRKKLERAERSGIDQEDSLLAASLPHIPLDGITVGKTEDVKLGKVTVTPDLFSLLTYTKIIRSIEIDSLVLTQKGIDKMTGMVHKSDPQLPPLARVDAFGKVGHPMLLPTKAALAGAAAGTVLMPGLGTGLGAKAGQALEGLFGRKEAAKK